MPENPNHKDHLYLTSPDLWARLKPLARQKRRRPTPAEEAYGSGSAAARSPT